MAETDPVVEWAQSRPRNKPGYRDPTDIAADWIVRYAPVVEAARVMVGDSSLSADLAFSRLERAVRTASSERAP